MHLKEIVEAFEIFNIKNRLKKVMQAITTLRSTKMKSNFNLLHTNHRRCA